MPKKLFAGHPPITQLILTAFAMLTSMLLIGFIGMLLAPVLFGISMAEFMNIIAGGDVAGHLNVFRYMQTLYGISLFIVPALFLGYLFSETLSDYFGFGKILSVKYYFIVFLIVLTVVPFINLLASLNEMIVFPESLSWLETKLRMSEDSAQKMTKQFLDVEHIGGMLFNIFMIALLPALGEELIFRGVFQKIFVRWSGSIHVGIIISAFCFSAMHVQFYGFFPRWLLGCMFGYMLVWSGSIWLPIFAHFTYNALAVIVSYMTLKGYLSEEIAEYGSSPAHILVTVAATAVCGWLYWRMNKSLKVQ